MSIAAAILISFGLIFGFIVSSESKTNTPLDIITSPAPVTKEVIWQTPIPVTQKPILKPTNMPSPRATESTKVVQEGKATCTFSEKCGGEVRYISNEECAKLVCCSNNENKYVIADKTTCEQWMADKLKDYQDKTNQAISENKAKLDNYFQQIEQNRLEAYNECVASAHIGNKNGTTVQGFSYIIPGHTDTERLKECEVLYGKSLLPPSPSPSISP